MIKTYQFCVASRKFGEKNFFFEMIKFRKDLILGDRANAEELQKLNVVEEGKTKRKNGKH